MFDLLLGSVGLLVLACLLPFLAIVLKLVDGGPLFYVRERLGQGGSKFKMVKLRTMVSGSDADVASLRTRGRFDERVTPVGRLLRRLYIDELPQFWNVVKGEMSVVGPRPEYAELVSGLEKLDSRFRDREVAKPGVTGLAQVTLPHATSEADAVLRLEYDLAYIGRGSLVEDCRIVVRTILRLFKFQGM